MKDSGFECFNTIAQLLGAKRLLYAIKKRTTCRKKFFARLEKLIPWQKLKQQLSKGYQKTGVFIPAALLT